MINLKEQHSKFVKLYSFSSGATSSTNIRLVEEMISHLDEEIFKNPNSKFLDPCAGTGTFGVVLYDKLLKYHDSKWILENMIFMVDTSRVNFDLLKKLGFVNVYNDDFLKLKFDMKFDVILGNPPYQDTSANREVFNQLGNKKLWKLFLENSSKYVKDDGIISFLVPQSCTKPTIYGELPVSIKNMGDVRVLNVNTNVNSYFNGVGIKICAITFKKTSETVNCFVNGYKSDFNIKGFLTSNKILDSILNKILKNDNTVTVTRHSKEYSIDDLNNIGGIWSSRFAYPQFSNERLDGYELNWKSNQNKNKELMVLLKSNMFLKTAWDSFVVLDKRWYHNFWSALSLHSNITEFTTEQELHKLYDLDEEEIEYLNSKDMTHIG